jgi:hypothetical protein
MKLLLKVNGMLGPNIDMHQKVDEFTSYIEKLMENYDLKNKEIFSVQTAPLVKQGSDQQLKKSKDMDKIRKDLDQYKKKNANLQKTISGKFVGPPATQTPPM